MGEREKKMNQFDYQKKTSLRFRRSQTVHFSVALAGFIKVASLALPPSTF
jgi:hypothetical protein